jgi:hypothetical protein
MRCKKHLLCNCLQLEETELLKAENRRMREALISIKWKSDWDVRRSLTPKEQMELIHRHAMEGLGEYEQRHPEEGDSSD